MIDPVDSVADGVAEAAAGSILDAVSAWILDGVVWTVRAVFSFFDTATAPRLSAAWFSGDGGPYAMTVQIAGMLLIGFTFVAITQGVLSGDVGGTLRVFVTRLPGAVLAMVATVGVTDAAVAATDAISAGFLSRFAADGEHIAVAVDQALPATGTTPPVAVVLLGLVAVLAGIVVVAELVIRSALIYVVVALAPFAFAAQVWPVLRGASRRVLESLAALVLSKLAIAVALSVATAAMASTLPAPQETASAAAASSGTAVVGVLLMAVAAFGVAAFSPVLIHRLLPLTEAAAVAHGVRGGPMRATRSVLATSNSAAAASHRLRVLATGAAAGAAPATAASAAAAGGPAAVRAVATGATQSRAASESAPGPSSRRRQTP